MRVGILGGTFDPIHCGHLTAAEHARKALGLDRVLFVPAHRSPLKPDARASAAHRATMVRLAIANDLALALSTVDIARPPPSYAVDTVALLRQESPETEFVFLIGADQLAELSQWRAPEKLAQLAPIVALTRPGVAGAAALQALPAGAQDRVTWQEIPPVYISASAIRERVAAGLSIRGLTPPAVIAYIARHGLYRRGEDGANDRA